MKKKYILFLIIAVSFCKLSAQDNITVYYDWMTDFPIKEFVAHGQSREKILKMNAFKRPRKYCYSNGKSVYQTLQLSNDTIFFKDRMIFMRQYTEPYIYKNFSQDSMYFVDMKNEPFIVATKSMPRLNKWKILPDTMTILGYICQKACWVHNDRETHEAWYAVDIPIMDGPETYFGLPGLILEIHIFGSFIIRASKIELGSCPESLTPVWKTKISYDEYLRRRKMYGRGLTPN